MLSFIEIYSDSHYMAFLLYIKKKSFTKFNIPHEKSDDRLGVNGIKRIMTIY